MTKSLSKLVLLMALTGCYRFHYVNGQSPQATPADGSWHHDFIFGLVEASDPVDLGRICPEGFAHIDGKESFWNGFLHSVTYGIYTPQSVEVTCAVAVPKAAIESPVATAPLATPAPEAASVRPTTVPPEKAGKRTRHKTAKRKVPAAQ